MAKLRQIILLFFIVCLPAQAQTPVQLAPVAHQQFLANDGTPLAGGLVYTYAAGTSTPSPTYIDSGGTTLNTNPIVLDAGGFATIWVGMQNYKFCVANSLDVQQWCVDNINPFQIQSGNTFAGPITFSSTMSALGGGAFAGTFTGNPTFSGNPIFSGAPNFTGTTTFTGNTLLQGVVYPWIDPISAGAKCDGTTDDAVALQNSINAAISTDVPFKWPPGKTCYFKTTLTATGPIKMDGYFVRGSGTTVPPNALYGGTGTAININNGTSLIYNVNLRNFYLLSQNIITTGIACTYCNTLNVQGVQVGGTETSLPTPGMTNSFDFSNSAGIIARDNQTFSATTAFKLTNVTNLNVDGGEYGIHNQVFLLNGSNSGIEIHDVVDAEQIDYFVNVDDSLGSLVSILGLHAHNNYILFDSASYSHNNVLNVNNAGSNLMTISNADFDQNTVDCSGPCVGNYAFNINISGSTNASTAVNLLVRGGYIYGYTLGGVTANNAKASVVWDGVSQSASTDVNGTGTFTDITYSNGLSVNNITSTNTLAIKRDRANQGTAQTSGNVALSSSPTWGSGATVSVTGEDEVFSVSVTAAGTPAADPFITITFADGAWPISPICTVSRGEANSPQTAPWLITSLTATTMTVQFWGTPVAASQYTGLFLCRGR